MSPPIRFSIVMPTRNRAPLLRHALKTALSQTGQFEVVVVDNHSTDETNALVTSMTDTRLRYVRTERVLPQHDNWERAVGEARGEWVLILADDDALVPSFVSRLARVADRTDRRAISWGEAVYFHPNHPNDSLRNTMYVDRMNWGIHDVDCRPRLEQLYRLQEALSISAWPRFGETCAVRRDALDDLRRAAGRLFHPPSSDTSFGALLLAQEPAYTFVAQPWILRGFAATSLSTGFQRRTGPEEAFTDEFGDGAVLHHVPVRTLCLHNIVADSLLEVQRVAPRLLSQMNLDWARYFEGVRRDLDAMADHADVSSDVDAWRQACRTLRPEVRRTVAMRLARDRIQASLRKLGRAAAERAGWARTARQRWRARRTGEMPFTHAEGSVAGFSDAAQAAFHLDAILASWVRDREPSPRRSGRTVL